MKIYQHKAIRAVAALGVAAAVGFAPTAVAQESSPLWSISEDLVNINRDIRISYDNIDVSQGDEATEEPSSVDPDAASNPDITFSTTDNTAWFSVDSRTGEITVNPGTEVPPSDYTFLITVNYGSSLTRTGQDYVQNVRARVTVHAQGYAPETTSAAADTSTPAASTPASSTAASSTAASLPDLTPALTDLINQGTTNLQDLINQIQQQTDNATADAAASLQNLQALLEAARAQADEALQAEIDRLLNLINQAAATAAQAAQDAAAAAQDAVNQGVNDASAAVSSAAAASSQASAAAADAAAVASSASAAASSAAAAAVDGVRDVNIDVNGNINIQGPTYNVPPEQIAEFNRLLAERTRAFLEASGTDFNLTSEEMAIAINGVVNISALLEDPAAFYEQLNQLLEQALTTITDDHANINVELPGVVDEINNVIDDAINEITENTDPTTDADATADASESSAAAATEEEVTNTSKRKTLANTGPEVLGMVFAALALGGAGFLLTKRGARS
ncbi:MAG: Rib/alpha-like domain-containing protein [Corynebacterium sp.]|nr:Rib/alpha-like domain-containing protein [Corynebacterium sp.]